MKLSPADYRKLLNLQGGRCAICEGFPPANRRLAVDHCHRRYVVRGLLCTRCNLGLGLLEDDYLRQQAIKYLDRAREFRRNDKPLTVLSSDDLLNAKFPEEDWRLCREPFLREILLRDEIIKRFVTKIPKRQIAKKLGISHSTVDRLLGNKFRWDKPVYYDSSEVIWPDETPSR
jgi:hypothetical protein